MSQPRIGGSSVYRVAVFWLRDSRIGALYTAYTRTYNPAWEGCCIHEVMAESGAEAKREAIERHRRQAAAGLGCARKDEEMRRACRDAQMRTP